MTPDPTRLLLLGGTTESLALAERLTTDPRLAVITSLAGRTVAHRLPPGELRVGGFGGTGGLVAYLRAQAIGLVVDATHPFAATISGHAAEACREAGLPRLQLLRPAWTPAAGDRWHEVADTAAAAAALPALGRTIFLAVGRQDLGPFATLTGRLRLIARMIEPQRLPGFEVILARGPFTPADEAALFERAAIDVVVSKNSGGEASWAKIAAARTCGLPVVMIRRPPPEAGDRAADLKTALAWVQARLDHPPGSA
ncbi:MAG: cobalt-precorrin-6A reductase [Rhodospirillaceae bacterium]